MTIILSLVTGGYALQISDRRLTQEKKAGLYDVWDPASNKSVILLGRDGVVSMGYSGPAFIGRATTDGWIAQVLTGIDLGANRERPDFTYHHGSGVPDRVLHAHLGVVEDRLNKAITARQLDRTLALYGVGLRWNSLGKPAWPQMARITWDSGRYTMAMSKKRWGWESGQSYFFGASGWSEVEAQNALRRWLRTTDTRDKDQTAATFIDVLRSLPSDDTTVSKDCLVTTIQRESPHVHVRYEPYGIAGAEVASSTRTFTVPVAFSPWVLTPTFLAAPQAISGPGWECTSGVIDFRIEGTGSGGDFMIVSSQPRRSR